MTLMDLPDFLTQWPKGEIVLTSHRIGLYSVIDLLERGCGPDEICEEFPTLNLDLIGQVVAFHQSHRAEVDAYVATYRVDLTHQEATSVPSPALLRIRNLMAERSASGQSSADS
jgi:uncharacterized protein (DUF433 family)